MLFVLALAMSITTGVPAQTSACGVGSGDSGGLGWDHRAFSGWPMDGLASWSEVAVDDSFAGLLAPLNISLLGRLPLYIGHTDMFPLLDIGLVLAGEGVTFAVTGDITYSRVKFGAGGDFDFLRNLFIRISLLGSFRYTPGYFTWEDKHSSRLNVFKRFGVGRRL